MSGEGRLRFHAVTPRPWAGRYRRVPGSTAVFHVRYVDGRWWPVVEWATDEGVGTCRMTDDGDVEALASSVNQGKAAQGAAPGGAFLVDEYGRVLVPASDRMGTSVFVVGECTGPLRFQNPFAPGTVIDLYADEELNPGDLWERPYVGVRYQLSGQNELYFWNEDDSGGRKALPLAQDSRLINELRRIRARGGVRFLVGPGGVVITKHPPLWEPRYVGRLKLATWYAKEDLE